MIARKYNKRISLFIVGLTDDGFGGSVPRNEYSTGLWAEVKQLSSFRDNTTGTSNIKNTFSFKIRYTPFIAQNTIDNLSIQYNSRIYVVNDIIYDGDLFREINIIANGISGD